MLLSVICSLFVFCFVFLFYELLVEGDLIRLEQKIHPLKRELLSRCCGKVDSTKWTNCPFFLFVKSTVVVLYVAHFLSKATDQIMGSLL